MQFIDPISVALASQFKAEAVSIWKRPCRPRILILADGGLHFTDSSQFGLWRFVHAITLAPGVTTKPILTLAHRTSGPGSVTVGPDTYTVHNPFAFDSFATPVTLANFDQIWIFGIQGGAFGLSPGEVGVLSAFMNGGGGVFATGDHASLGRALSGSLPRIRHMREWRDAASGGVPMGTEADANVAVMRNDTVVDPGTNNIYQFIDQSDDIPQRIFPNYKVTDSDGLGGSAWTATVHPVLMLPGAPAVRSSAAAGGAATGFVLDIDVLPDHPHESQCYAVTGATLNTVYNISGQNFAEFQPSAANPAVRTPAEVVAFAIAGGRSVLNGVWKPPVKPRMFGVISAYDGRLAQPYPGQTQRPGRIVCDATWHHYVNVNLDGTGSGRTGLGTGSGLAFVPSPDLEKIYAYYRNIITWLQPANRVLCSIFWDLIAVRVSALVREELIEIGDRPTWRTLVGLGRAAQTLLTQSRGRLALRDQVLGLLAADPGLQELADALADEAQQDTSFDSEELIEGVYGALLHEISRYLPDPDDEKDAESKLSEGPARVTQQLVEAAVAAVRTGAIHQRNRLERGVEQARQLSEARLAPEGQPKSC